MKYLYSIFLCLLMLITTNVFSNSTQIFDFKLIGGHMIVVAKTNNRTLNLLFDTGSSLSIIDSLKALQLNLPFLAKTCIPTPGGIFSGYTTNFDLFNEYNTDGVVMSMRHLSRLLKYPIDGLLGAQCILQKKIIDIDFEHHKIYIRDISPKIKKKFYSICLKNGNRSQDSGLGRFYSMLPVFEGEITFKGNFSEKVDLAIDTGCHYDFAVTSQDSSIIKNYANGPHDYFSLNGKKELIYFGNACINGTHKTNVTDIPFFYYPTLNIYKNELMVLVGPLTFKKNKRIIIDWPERVMYVKTL